MTAPIEILVVEDDAALRDAVCLTLEMGGHSVCGVDGGPAALGELDRRAFALVVSDLRMQPMDGLQLLAALRARRPHLPVLLMTAYGDVAKAVEAMQGGACDFLMKPFEPEALLERVRRYAAPPWSADDTIAEDAVSRNLLALAAKVAQTDATVLLTGESGTGKEVVARFIHARSPRAQRPFVAINCAAIPETLLESELFGYEKGAFTGAVKQTQGKIESAHKGTFFLDEIGDLPMALQAKLLRFLQERVIERIGGREEIPVDVRIVCATHRDLKAQIKAGLFREDLYYRLAEIVVDIPPLRERDGDAVLLAHAFVQRFAKENGRGSMHLGEDALAAIEGHAWPGNVRELENCLKRAVIMAETNRITADDLGFETQDSDLEHLNLRQVREEAERRAVVRVLARTNGNIARAADILGVSRPSLYDLMNRFGLKKEN